MKKILCFFCVYLFVFLTACQGSANTKNTEEGVFKILWIGDESLSFVPMQTLLLLSQGGQRQINLKNETLIGADYTITSADPSQIFRDPAEFSTIDLVVLQTFSPGQVVSAADFQTAVNTWGGYFNQSNVDMLLFFPQRVSGQDENEYQHMVDQSLQAAWAYQLPVAPVGDVWKYLENTADIGLMVDYPTHLSPAGVYLSASVFYSVFSGETAANGPVKTSIGFAQPDTIIVLDDEVINQINSAVRQVMEAYQRQGEFIVDYPLPINP